MSDQIAFSLDAEFAAELDRADPLRRFRNEFVISDPDLIYLDGNSLGRMPRATAERTRTLVAHEWGVGLVRSWGNGWFDAPAAIGAKIARLIGARPDEVVVADSTSVNLFKLAIAALCARPNRRTIVTDEFNFPSDLYVLQGAATLLGQGHHIEMARSPDTVHMPNEVITKCIDSDTALVSLTHVAFKSGYLYDMQSITAAAQDAGALVLWDLSHSVGAVPLELKRDNVDLAVGCSYKYVNGGPGAPAFIYVRRDLQTELRNPISGWMGQQAPFNFELHYQPQSDIRRFLSGTPPMISTAAVEAGADLLLEAGMEPLREKSLLQTEYLIYLFDRKLAPLGFTLGSPRAGSQRGSHVSIRHPDGLRIDKAMIHAMNVVPDFRAPDNIRLGITPLYTTFREIHTAITRIERVVERRLYEQFSDDAPTVT